MSKTKNRICCSECGQEKKQYTTISFCRPRDIDGDELCKNVVVIPFGPKGETFINIDPSRAVPVCFETQEECVEWMKQSFPLYQLTESI